MASSSSSSSFACAWCDLDITSCACSPSLTSSSSSPSSNSTSSSFLLSPRSFPPLPSRNRRLTETPFSIKKTLSLFHEKLISQKILDSLTQSTAELVKDTTSSLPKPGLSFSEAVKRPPLIKNSILDSPTSGYDILQIQDNRIAPNLKGRNKRFGWNRIFQKLAGRCIKCGDKGHRADSCRNARICFFCKCTGHFVSSCPKRSSSSPSSNTLPPHPVTRSTLVTSPLPKSTPSINSYSSRIVSDRNVTPRKPAA